MNDYKEIIESIDTNAIIEEIERKPTDDCPEISIKGSQCLNGTLKCFSFSSSGSLKAEGVNCFKEMKINGKALFSGNISAKNIYFRGTVACKGDVSAKYVIGGSGKFTCDKKISTLGFDIFGKACVSDTVHARSINIYGGGKCAALIGAKDVNIGIGGKFEAESIEGGDVCVFLEKCKRFLKKLPLLSLFVKNGVVYFVFNGRVARPSNGIPLNNFVKYGIIDSNEKWNNISVVISIQSGVYIVNYSPFYNRLDRVITDSNERVTDPLVLKEIEKIFFPEKAQIQEQFRNIIDRMDNL